MFIGDIVRVNTYFPCFDDIKDKDGIVLDFCRSGSGKRNYRVLFPGIEPINIPDVELDVVHSIHEEKKV